jgi:IS605 OrfB family transposase
MIEKKNAADENQIKIIKKKIDKLNNDRRKAVKKVKFEINDNVNNWELLTPKEIRAATVKEACEAFNTNMKKFYKGDLKFFKMHYRKKKDNKTIIVPPALIKIISDNKIQLAPSFLGDHNCILKFNKITQKKYFNKIYNGNINQFFIENINNETKIKKYGNKYFLLISKEVEVKEKIKPIRYCGIDPGVRSFMTVFGNEYCYEYKYDKTKINKLNNQIDSIKKEAFSISKKKFKSKRKRRKKAYNKREKKKGDLIEELHWKVVNDLVKKNDVIFYGDIKSHNISKTSTNKKLNRNFNDLKFYQFKCKLSHKMSIVNKLLYLVHEANTSKTCSFCGTINNPFEEKIYNCSKCNLSVDRDVNAAKNILMKGIMKNLIEV